MKDGETHADSRCYHQVTFENARKNIPGQVWGMVNLKGEVINPQICGLNEAWKVPQRGEGPNWAKFLRQPCPKLRVPSVYLIDDGIRDKILKFSANLGVVKSHGRRI